MKEILIVDDDKISSNALKLRLEKKEFKCTVLNNSEDCLKQIEKHDFNCVLLDILMPKVSGLEILTKIRESYNNFQLPVIMVTSKNEVEDIVSALKLGANDYLTKPVNIDIAKARVNTQINIKSLFQDSMKGKQLQTISNMVTTLHHEINNPLTIAIGNLTIMSSKEPSERADKAVKSLHRIADIVKKIETIVKDKNIREIKYSDTIDMLDLNNDD